MRTTLIDPEQQRTLDEFGFVVVPFLDDEHLVHLAALYEELGTAPDDPQLALYFGFHSASLDYKRAMGAAIRPVVAQRCAEVLDDHVVYLAIFITKWPGPQSGFGPHQDPTLVDERSYRGVSVWAPLQPTGIIDGRDNGMLHVVPGSHRFADGARVRDIDQSVFSPHEDAILKRHGVGVPTRPGEAIIFDNRLIHYSMPNETDQPRVVVSLGMRPSEATCVLPRSDGAGRIDLYPVTDDSWIEVTASVVEGWTPPDAPMAKVDPPSAVITAERLQELCDAVGPAPHTVPANRPSTGIDADDVNPGAFCAFCGTSEGFGELDRAGRGRAQLVCARCLAAMSDEGTAPALDLGDDGYRVFDLPSADVLDALREVWASIDPDRPSAYFASNVHLGRSEAEAVDRRLREIVGPALGPLLGDVEPFLAAFISKGARDGDRVEYHQDWTYTREPDERATILWIPLVDVAASNGALTMVPGSHRWTDGVRADSPDAATRFVQDELGALGQLVPLRAGQAVAYDPALVHGSTPNTSTEERPVVAVAFAPRGAQLVHFHEGPDGVVEGFEIDERYFTAAQYRSRPEGRSLGIAHDVVGPDDFARRLRRAPAAQAAERPAAGRLAQLRRFANLGTLRRSAKEVARRTRSTRV